MGKFAMTFIEIVDSHNDREDEIYKIKAKLADLEDRSRRNNIKIRGIPESVKPQELNAFLTNILKEVVPEAQVTDLIIDLIYRLPKHIPDNLHRDTISRIHFFHIKEKLLK